MNRIERLEQYAQGLSVAEREGCLVEFLRELARTDLFFLLTRVLNRADADRDWLFDRCNEVQAAPDGYLDLWAREHYKSTIITFALTIQEILKNPEITIGIFSHTRPIAKGFLRQIKREFELNEHLKALFPEVLYENPRKESPKWSEDDGIVVRRATNPKEATVEAWGLVDGQPTSKHYALMIYDDVVTRESVTTPDMIAKTTDAWALSRNLSSEQGGLTRYIGTRYHANDTWAEIIRRKAAVPRLHPPTDNGKADGTPVLLTPERLAKKREEMGPYIFACHGAGTLITMADWSQKPIEAVMVGDEVVGWAHFDGGQATLTPTRVIATNSRKAPAVRSTLRNGDVLIHTPDHKWWTGRAPREDGSRHTYSPLGFGYGFQSGLCKVVGVNDTYRDCLPDQNRAAGYLAAIIDGEGGIKHRTVQVTQDQIQHPGVCAQIEWCLDALGFSYGICDSTRGKKNQRIYTIHGGRAARVRLLHVLGGHFGKREQLISQCYGSRNFGKSCRVELAEQSPVGDIDVFNIQTETGNYVAGGYASKNCQMLQDPKQDAVMGFKREWLRFWRPAGWEGMNRYVICDPASEKKKTSDYTVFAVLGLAADRNYYLIDMIRDRLNLTERARTLFYLHQKYRPLMTGYEKYGLQSDIEHFNYVMEQNAYRFPIIELGGSMPKNDRIRRLVPIFESGRLYIPDHIAYTDYEGHYLNLSKIFTEDEYEPFPVSAHDDMLDALSRVMDPELTTIWPVAPVSPIFQTPAQQDWQNITGQAPGPYGYSMAVNIDD